MSVRGGSTDTLLPIIAADTVTADSSNVQIIELGTVAAGVLTRTPIPAQGQAAMAASLPVVVASNQTAIPVSQPGLGGGVLQTITTVGAAAVALPASALASRAVMLVQNVGTTTIYLGSSTVTANTASTGGLQLLPGQSVPISLSSAVTLYAISSAVGGLVMTFEVAA